MKHVKYFWSFDGPIKQTPLNTPYMYGAKGDGGTDDTVAINICLAENDIVYIPDGVYMIDATVSVKPRSGQTIIMAENAVLKCIPTDKTYYDVIKIQNVADVTIKGGKICGDKNEHLVTTGEFGYGIGIYNAQRITIDGCEIYNHWGDAVCIISRKLTGDFETDACRDIVVKNSVLHDCRRQGISVVGCIGFLADNVKFYCVGGTAPQSGIDFEADTEGSWNDDCIVRNSNIQDCVYGIFANARTKNVTVDGCNVLNRSAFRQSGKLEIGNSTFGDMYLGGNESIVLYSTLKDLSAENSAKKMSVAYCSFFPDDGVCCFSCSKYNGTTSECVIDIDHCTFHTFKGNSVTYQPAFGMTVYPKRFAIKNSTLFINNPNGMHMFATDAVDLIGNTFVVNYNNPIADKDTPGVGASVFMTVKGECYIAGNTYKRIDSSCGLASHNSAYLVSANNQNVTFINNVCLGTEKIGPDIFVHSGSSGSIKAINNVFPQYAKLGLVGTDVAVTEIGNVYSTTT